MCKRISLPLALYFWLLKLCLLFKKSLEVVIQYSYIWITTTGGLNVAEENVTSSHLLKVHS